MVNTWKIKKNETKNQKVNQKEQKNSQILTMKCWYIMTQLAEVLASVRFFYGYCHFRDLNHNIISKILVLSFIHTFWHFDEAAKGSPGKHLDKNHWNLVIFLINCYFVIVYLYFRITQHQRKIPGCLPGLSFENHIIIDS